MNDYTKKLIDNFQADTSEGCTFEEQFESYLKTLRQMGKITREEEISEYEKLFPSN